MKKSFFLCIVIISFALSSCTQKPILWPDDSIKLHAFTYELPILDTHKIMEKNGNYYTIVSLNDTFKRKHDTINYNIPKKDLKPYFTNNKIKTAKTSGSNPAITEYYLFEKGAVKLAGYTTGNPQAPATLFSEPLVILPSIGTKTDSSEAIQQNWDPKKNNFKKGTKIKTNVKLVNTGTLLLDGQKEEFLLYELTLTGDALTYYGEQQLVMPGAIYLQSHLLYGKTKGLLYEWSIKSKPITAEQNEAGSKPNYISYLEIIKYNPVKE
jgi:hypothetical protein